MIKPNQRATIDEVSLALAAFQDAAKRGIPISHGTADDIRGLVDELKTRKAIRDEILRIAEEMADEEEAAEHREEAEHTHRLAARMANTADDLIASYYGLPSGAFKIT